MEFSYAQLQVLFFLYTELSYIFLPVRTIEKPLLIDNHIFRTVENSLIDRILALTLLDRPRNEVI